MPEPQATCGSRHSGLEQLRRDVHPRRSQRRRQAARDRRDQRQEDRVRDQPRIRNNRESKRQLAGQCQRVEKGDHSEREQRAATGAHRAEHQSLGEQCLNETRTSRTERDPNCNLMLTTGCARQEEARHIAAGDEQDESEQDEHGHGEQQHFWWRSPEHEFVERKHAGRLAQSAVRFGVAPFQLFPESRHCQLGSFCSIAPPQPRDHCQGVAVLASVESRQEQFVDRRVEIRLPKRHHRSIVAWQNPDDTELFTIQLHRTSDNAAVFVESAAPEVVAQDDDAWVPFGLPFVEGERAPCQHLYSQRLEEVPRDCGADHALSRPVDAKIRTHDPIGDDVFENPALAEVQEIRIGKLIAIPWLDADDVLRIQHCRLMQQDRAKRREYRCVDPDAYAQRQDASQHECRASRSPRKAYRCPGSGLRARAGCAHPESIP